MARPIFKILGLGIIASAVLFLISVLLFSMLKIAFILLAVGGLAKLFLRNKFQGGLNGDFRQRFNSGSNVDALYDFNHSQKKFHRNREIVSINIQ